MKSPIFGPAYQARSTNLASAQLVNLFQQIVEAKSPSGKAVGALENTPGLDLLGTVGSGPIRAMLTVSLQGVGERLYVLSGQNLYQVASNFSAILLGSIPETNDGPAQLISNGVEVGIFAGWNAARWSKPSGFSQIVLPVRPQNSPTLSPITAGELDGFVVANQPFSDLLFQSNLLDLGTWNALNFGEASGEAGILKRVAAIHRELVLIKDSATEFWYNAGTSGLEFARIDGAYLEVGICAVQSCCRLGDTLVWLAQNQEGEGFAVELEAHKFNRISTQAVEDEWAGYGAMSDAVAYTYRQAGHEFYALNFPTGDTTWVYDRTASRMLGEPCWHQRARFETTTGTWHRHIGNCAALFSHKIVVGDYQNGNLYAFNRSTLQDSGNTRRWVRRWRALAKPANQPVTFSELSIDMQTGIGIDPSANPQVALRWSDDGGHSWSNERQIAVGKLGETARRVRATRLGQTRLTTGLDRIFELSSTDMFPVTIIDANVDAS